MRGAPHQPTARFGTSAARGLLGLATGSLAALALVSPTGAAAEPAPDLAGYDCVRLDDASSVAGDDLIAGGFEIVSIGRFGRLIVALAHPESGTQARCESRSEEPS